MLSGNFFFIGFDVLVFIFARSALSLSALFTGRVLVMDLVGLKRNICRSKRVFFWMGFGWDFLFMENPKQPRNQLWFWWVGFSGSAMEEEVRGGRGGGGTSTCKRWRKNGCLSWLAPYY